MDRLRVMVVEDNREIQQSIVRYLSAKEDIEVVAVAANGVEARRLVMQTKPDVLVLDIIMPLQDGFAVMRQLRDEGIGDMRIIVLSGIARDSLIRQAMELGAYYYLVKPFDPELLYSYIVQKDSFDDDMLGAVQPLPLDESAALDKLLGETMGIPMHTKGGRYLHAAVRIAAELGSLSGRITKEVYPAVAQLYDTGISQVERAIRHAIEMAWTNGSMRKSGLFPANMRPTNGAVIGVLAARHLQDMRRSGARKGEPGHYF